MRWLLAILISVGCLACGSEATVPTGGERLKATGGEGDLLTNTYTVTVSMNQKAGTVDILTRKDGVKYPVGGPETVIKFDDPDGFNKNVETALLKAVVASMQSDVEEFFSLDGKQPPELF